ncbi:TIGR01244 family sulfur transferase [Yoonia sp.]|jgi:sulfide:quinone oxidoreductase|uniref:TIGR01244 family sulfur transferase n=1 Tax=Yoonia sp. TaxID=2212373 RepID=UPI003F6C2BF7
MDIRRITDDFAISDQLTQKDVTQAHALGYETILCMRPDGEEPAQPLFEDIERAAKTTQITAKYLPVPAAGPTDDNVADFAKIYKDLPKPVLAYCRSGGRVLKTFQRAFPKDA